MKSNSRSIAIVVALALIVACAAGWWFWQGSQAAKPKKAAAAAPPVPVTVGKATQRNVPIAISVVGRAEAKASVTVKSRVDGQITSLDYKEGQAVKRGQLLARLDPQNFAAVLRQTDATAAKGQAQLDKLRQDLARNRNLAKQGFISQAQLNQSESDFLASEASARADVAAGDIGRLTLGYTTIRAPMDGVAGAAQVHPGSTVKANDTPILLINQLQPMYASFAIPEVRLGQLKAATAKGPVPVTATVPGTQISLKGQTAFIDNAVDMTTGTILVKAQFANENNELTPGQFVNISLVVEQLENAVLVPTAAVQIGPNGNFLFVVKKDLTVDMRPVKVQATLGDETVIASGVKAGETVVTDGQSRLKQGVKVELFAQHEQVAPTNPAAARAGATAGAPADAGAQQDEPAASSPADANPQKTP